MEEEAKKKKIYRSAINKYNAKTYDRMSFALPKQLVADFKAKCKETGTSGASIVRKAMEEFVNE